jgi:hypothetical protein
MVRNDLLFLILRSQNLDGADSHSAACFVIMSITVKAFCLAPSDRGRVTGKSSSPGLVLRKEVIT